MVRRRRKLREQAAAVRDLGGATDGLLTMGDTNVSDAFSFLPPGQPAGGAGARVWVDGLDRAVAYAAEGNRCWRLAAPLGVLAASPAPAHMPRHAFS